MGGKSKVVRNRPDVAKLHKRYETDAAAIVECADALGDFYALEKYDIRSLSTLDRIRERYQKRKGENGDGHHLAIDKIALHKDEQSFFESLVGGIVNRITKLEAALAEKEQVIDRLREQIATMQQERQNSKVKQREHTALVELINKVGGKDGN